MYYLLIRNDRDIALYRKEFDRAKENISHGRTPVWSEMRSAKINLIESAPYNFLLGAFMVIAALLVDKIKINDTVKIAAVLVVNSCCGAISNYIFVKIKHQLRLKLCDRMHIEPSEENIAVMESLEYQSV